MTFLTLILKLIIISLRIANLKIMILIKKLIISTALKKESKISKTSFKFQIKRMIRITFLMLCGMLSDTFWCRKETAYDELEMKNNLPDFLYEKMLELKEGLVIDLRINTFERNCLEANELLISQNLFLEVSKLKKKFSIWSITVQEKQYKERIISVHRWNIFRLWDCQI